METFQDLAFAIVPFFLNGVNGVDFTHVMPVIGCSVVSVLCHRLNTQPLVVMQKYKALVVVPLIVVAYASWRARFYMLVWSYIFVFDHTKIHTIASSPFREVLRFMETYMHYTTLKIPFTFASVLRHTLTGTARDVTRKQDNPPLCINHPRYHFLYTVMVLAFAVFVPVPYYATLAYVIIACNMHTNNTKWIPWLWFANYCVELWFRQQITFDYRYDWDRSKP